jgi:hypothetical protein
MENELSLKAHISNASEAANKNPKEEELELEEVEVLPYESVFDWVLNEIQICV